MELASSSADYLASGGPAEGEEAMSKELDAGILVDRIDSLREPYRKNAIEWVESCANQAISDLPRDIRRMLRKMPAVRRKAFIDRTVEVLDGAVRHFGR